MSHLVLGPDNNFYISSAANGKVLKFSGSTGGFLGDFINSNLAAPNGMVFSPDASILFVANSNDGTVGRFDALTGAFLGVAFERADGLNVPRSLVFGPDGFLYIGDSSWQRIYKGNVLTGTTTVFVDYNVGGLDAPYGLAFAPDRHLYVADGGGSSKSVLEYAANGTFLRRFYDGFALGVSPFAVRPGTCGPVPPARFSVGNRVWLDNGQGGGVIRDGLQNGTEPGLANVLVQLRNSSGVVVNFTTTDGDGYYRFDNVAEGNGYTICIPAANFGNGQPLQGLVSSPGAMAGTDRGDNGLDNANPGANGICSAPFNLGPGLQLLNEPDISSGAGAHAPTGDANDTLTVDFAFAPPRGNHLPIAGPDTNALCACCDRLTLSVESLLANDTDEDGDRLTVVAVSATSESGGTVVLTGGTIVYTPPGGLAGPDQFTYEVSDGFGGTAVGTVTVTSDSLTGQPTINWTNTAGGNWNLAVNWSPNRIPSATDIVGITACGTYTVTLSSLTANPAGLILGCGCGTQTLVVSAGATLPLSAASVVHSNGVLNLNGGTITGAGSMTVEGTLNWTSGTMSGGATVIAPGGTLNVSGPGTKTLDARALVNNGTWNWSGGTFTGQNGAAITNTTVLNVQTDTALANGGGNPAFYNLGTVRKTAGTGTTTFGMAFNNAGLLEVQTGWLSLSGGGGSTGLFNIAAGAELSFVSGYTLGHGATTIGLGTFRLNTAGTLVVTGTVGVRSLVWQQGAASVVGTLDVTDLTATSGNPITLSGPGMMNVYGLATLSSGPVTGSANVTVYGTLNWLSGNLSGAGALTVAPGGTLNLSSASTKYLDGRAVNNAGTCNWSGGSLLGLNAAVISNRGTWNVQVDATLGNYSGPLSTFNNSGLLRKTAGAGTTSVSMLFNNQGSVDVQSGYLSLAAGGTATGQFLAAAGAEIDFLSPHTLGNGSLLAGAGSFRVNQSGPVTVTGTVAVNNLILDQGACTINGTLNVTNLTVASGNPITLNGPGTLNVYGLFTLSSSPFTGAANVTVYGTMTWSSGTISGAGALTIAPGGTLNLSSASTKYLDGRALNNAGTCNWSGGSLLGLNAAVLSNSGMWNVQADYTLGHYSGPLTTFNNSGTLRKTTGTGTTFVSTTFNNTGAVEAQTGAFSFTAGGAATGSFKVAQGYELGFSAPYTFNPNSTLTGAG